MKKSQIATAIVVATVALSGCSKTGVETHAKADVSTKANSSLEKSLGVDKAKAATAKVDMPAAALELSALRRALPKMDPAHAEYARAILSTAKPVYGWPVPPFSLSPSLESWTTQRATDAIFADRVLTLLHQQLPAGALADPRTARKTIAGEFQAIPSSLLSSMRNGAERKTNRETTLGVDLNTVETSEVAFRLGDAAFSGSPKTGWAYSENGEAWFGEGKLSGQDMTIGLESTINRTLAEKKAMANSHEAGQQNEAGATTGIDARGE